MKLIFTLVFIICVNLTPSGVWPAYILFLTLALVELILAKLSLKKILLRSLISFPFVLAALPLLFTGTDPIIPLFSIGKVWIFISQPGLIRFGSIAIKSWISILSAILLTSTTKFTDILVAFRKIGIPQIFVAIVSLMWRYLSLMIDNAQSLMRARNSRSGSFDLKRRTGASFWWRGQVTGKMTGNLLLRSIEQSDRIYSAMLSRGYNGELFKDQKESLSPKERLFVSTSSFFSVAILALSMLLK